MGWECRCGRSAVAEEGTVSILSAVLCASYKAELEAIDAREPCPLLLEVDVCVLSDHEARGEDSRSTVAVEWDVKHWFKPGHVMNFAGVSCKHDGRTPDAQRVLWEYVMSTG